MEGKYKKIIIMLSDSSVTFCWCQFHELLKIMIFLSYCRRTNKMEES